MSVAISAYKQYSVHLYFQLFLGGIMSYLRHLCLFCLYSSCVPKCRQFLGIDPFFFLIATEETT